jgi:hypothetical protein
LVIPAANPRELARQMFGRLGNIQHETVASVIAAAQQDIDLWPRPLWPSLSAKQVNIAPNGGLSPKSAECHAWRWPCGVHFPSFIFHPFSN